MINRKKMDRLEKVEAVTKRLGKKTPAYVVVIAHDDTLEDYERKVGELIREWDEYGEPPELPFPMPARILVIGGSRFTKAAEDGVHVGEKPVNSAEEVHGTH